MKDGEPPLTPALLLKAYAAGIFPMAESHNDDEVFWVDPRRRGILPLERFHISRSLARRLRKGGFEITLDREFAGVVGACAAREETWISNRIARLYMDLHKLGYAHSLEVRHGGLLSGGVYGVALGGAFFGESMFSRRADASKIALAFLTDHLRRCGFTLFDTQFVTTHLVSLGAIEITRDEYHARLQQALAQQVSIWGVPLDPDPQALLQRRTQMS